MEFGKLSNVDRVDWSLPATDPKSIEFLRQSSEQSHSLQRVPFGKMVPFLGTPAWGHAEWKGKIYPKKTPATQFLYYYSRQFQTIELNTTHYRIPDAAQIQKWREQVPRGFQFCPKVFQGLSHSLEGLQDKALLRSWLDSLAHFQEFLGPCFLQLPPNFDYSKKAFLFHFLQAWPDDYELAIEFRHPSWFTKDNALLPALGEYLHQRRMGVVIIDVAGRRDLIHGTITTSFVMLRLIGNNLHPSDFQRSKAWAQRLADWQNLGLKRAYYFVHEPDDLLAPEMADVVIQDLNETCQSDLPRILWIETSPPQPSLF